MDKDSTIVQEDESVFIWFSEGMDKDSSTVQEDESVFYLGWDLFLLILKYFILFTDYVFNNVF